MTTVIQILLVIAILAVAYRKEISAIVKKVGERIKNGHLLFRKKEYNLEWLEPIKAGLVTVIIIIMLVFVFMLMYFLMTLAFTGETGEFLGYFVGVLAVIVVVIVILWTKL